eukprot:Opistho-2@46186
MSTRVYVGHVPSRARTQDLEDLFRRYGRIVNVDLKNGFAFVEFEDDRDAEDAIRALDGTNFEGDRIIVQAARSGRGGRDERGGDGKGNICFSCGRDGHWASDCPDAKVRTDCRSGLCFKCGESGHLARNCNGGGGGRGRSRSRSPRGRRSPSPRRDYDRRRSPSPPRG